MIESVLLGAPAAVAGGLLTQALLRRAPRAGHALADEGQRDDRRRHRR